MSQRHWIATGPFGSTTCSTKDAAARTLQATYRLSEPEYRSLLACGQRELDGALLETFACDCEDASCHITEGLPNAA